MRVIGLDPASRVTGVAVLDGPADAPRLLTAERLTSRAGGKTADLAYLSRIASMAVDVCEILTEYEPSHAVIEMPHGKSHAYVKKNDKGEIIPLASLSIYGVAAGAFWWLLAARVPHVKAVSVAGIRMTKEQRQRVVRAAFPTYDAGRDPGMDVSDAAWLALRELGRLEAAKEASDEQRYD